jgi:hypothetical protein
LAINHEIKAIVAVLTYFRGLPDGKTGRRNIRSCIDSMVFRFDLKGIKLNKKILLNYRGNTTIAGTKRGAHILVIIVFRMMDFGMAHKTFF